MHNDKLIEKPGLSNTIYIPEKIRSKSEELAIDTSFHRERQISKSRFVQYLIEHFGECAKNQLIGDAKKKIEPFTIAYGEK